MSENRYAPELKPYKDIGQFRFWCQKVLPLVYDDSLSYYELLCKVVNYLNDVIANSGVEEENIASLLIAFKELEDFVISEIDPSVFEGIYERLNTVEGKMDALEQLQIAQKFAQLDAKDSELMEKYVELKTLVDSFDFINWKAIVEGKLQSLDEEDGKLWEAYNELKDYLDNINWTELISDKIDELVEEGVLTGVEIATAERLGGIKIGDTLKIDSATGVANVNLGTGFTRKPDGTINNYDLITNKEQLEAVTRTGASVVEAFLLKQLLQEGAKEYTELHVHTDETDLYGKQVKATLIVSEEGLSEEVTGEFDDNGYANLRVYNIGTYRVSCTDEEGTWSQDVVVSSFTIIVVDIAKFRATINVNVNGGADVTQESVRVLAVSGDRTYSALVTGGSGIVVVGKGNSNYTVRGVVTDEYDNEAVSSTVIVNVGGEGSYSAEIGFAKIEVDVSYETNASVTLSNGEQSISYELTTGGTQTVGHFVNVGNWTIQAIVDGEESTQIVNVTDYEVYHASVSAKYVPVTINGSVILAPQMGNGFVVPSGYYKPNSVDGFMVQLKSGDNVIETKVFSDGTGSVSFSVDSSVYSSVDLVYSDESGFEKPADEYGVAIVKGNPVRKDVTWTELYASVEVSREEALYGQDIVCTWDGGQINYGTHDTVGGTFILKSADTEYSFVCGDGIAKRTTPAELGHPSVLDSVVLMAFILKPFAECTDEEVTIACAKYYDGSITLEEIQELWHVGDTRTMHLKAMPATYVGESHIEQDVTVTIIDFNHDKLSIQQNEFDKALVTLQTVTCLESGGYMNSARTNVGGWNACNRRSWCNDIFINALPTSIANGVKTVNKITSVGNASSTLHTTEDKAFLLSENEIFGSSHSSSGSEGTQYPYYTNHGKEKILNGGSPSSNTIWWERSPYVTNTVSFCAVYANGTANNNPADIVSGIAPAFCM